MSKRIFRRLWRIWQQLVSSPNTFVLIKFFSYYCDVCESLRDIDGMKAENNDPSMSSFASQLKGL